MGGRWGTATKTKRDGLPRCQGFTKFLDGPNKGQPSSDPCKRYAQPGLDFCKTHAKERGQL